MREIKFRAWDWTQIHYWWFSVHATWVIEETPLSGKLSSIMQYTWLKDKNWKEIYEGDIVETVDAFHWEDKIFKCEVKYKGWHYYADWFNNWWTWWDYSESVNWKDCVVIWNIYQNPELLKN